MACGDDPLFVSEDRSSNLVLRLGGRRRILDEEKKWLVGTIHCLYPRIVQAIFFPAGRRSEILDEKKKLRVVTRFGS